MDIPFWVLGAGFGAVLLVAGLLWPKKTGR